MLFEVYGLESSTFHFEAHGADPDWEKAAIVKTHQLPHELPDILLGAKVVYLVRDGRDAVVSLAHHRKDIFDSGSSLDQNMLEAMNADEGSYFGGWTRHVLSWYKRADLIIRFEDLIADPIRECERLRGILDLPKPKKDAPTFSDLKSGQPEYGSGKYHSNKNLASNWFRSGKVNGWETEMSERLQTRFWHLHGEAMEYAGYSMSGEPVNQTWYAKPSPPISVLIEAGKVTEPFTDGIKRLVLELLRTSIEYPIENVRVTALIDGKFLTPEASLELAGQGRLRSNGTLFRIGKQVLNFLLPSYLYNALARKVSSQKLSASRQRLIQSSTHADFDFVILTLPQHFQLIEHIQTKKTIGIIHDLTHRVVPEFHQENNIRLTQQGMDFLAERKAHMISVSKSTASDLDHIGLESTMIYEGVNRQIFYPKNSDHWKNLIFDRYEIPRKEFLLSVCTLEPRKNLKGLLRAYSRLDPALRKKHPMVLAGRKGWHFSTSIVPEECRTDVHFIGFVSEAHLSALYSNACGFCYISHYEGFGLPVLESVACGCPVMDSNNTSLAEIVGDSGVQVDPNSEEAIKEGLLQLLNPLNRTSLAEAAQKKSWQFTWSQMWRQLVAKTLS